MFPAKVPCPRHQCNDNLGRRFGVPAQITAISCHTCHVTASELLHMYIITLPHTHLHRTLQSQAMDNILDDLLPFSLPFIMALQV